MSSIPAPSGVETFWIGNFSAPWAILAFGAGWAQRSRLTAALGGVVAEVVCVFAFYSQSLVGEFEDPRRLLGSDPYAGLLAFTEAALATWLRAASPWLVAAIAAGVIYGLLGGWWGRSRAVLAGVALAMPFLAEPLAWRAYDGFLKGPLVVWAVEIASGIAILVWALRTKRTLATR